MQTDPVDISALSTTFVDFEQQLVYRFIIVRPIFYRIR